MIKKIFKFLFSFILVISAICFSNTKNVYADNGEYFITVEENKLVNVSLSKDRGIIGEIIEITVTANDGVDINEVYAVTLNGTLSLERLVIDEELQIYGPYLYVIEGFDAKIVVTVTAKSSGVVQPSIKPNTDTGQTNIDEKLPVWVYILGAASIVGLGVGSICIIRVIRRKRESW